jgi:hypothetical protein
VAFNDHNFSPTLKQRHCFDALMARAGKTQARLGREALTMWCLEQQGFSKVASPKLARKCP